MQNVQPMASRITEIRASLVAEMQKVYRLRTHVAVLAVTLSLLAALLVGQFLLTNYVAKNAKPGQPTMDARSIWQILHSFSQYVNPIVIALIVAYQSGKEFEWKTYHQIQLKGQTPVAYVISKLGTFFTLALATYLLQFLLTLIAYTVRTLVDNQPFDLPLLQILSDYTYSLLAISLSLLITVLLVSASFGIVMILVYLFVLEIILFPLIGTIAGALDKPGIADALSYAPMKLPERFVNSALAENYAGAVAILFAIIFVSALCGWLSSVVLNRRQIGLIR